MKQISSFISNKIVVATTVLAVACIVAFGVFSLHPEIGTGYDAQYQEARSLFIQGKHQEGAQVVQDILEENTHYYPAYYLLGLSQGYQGKYDVAEENFEKYLDSGISQWAGYLDLAWVQYKQNNFNKARITLEEGLEAHPENPWLLTSYGVVLHQIGEDTQAQEVLEQAQAQAANLTQVEWEEAYPVNPVTRSNNVETFRKLIAYNLSLVTGEIEEPDAEVVALATEMKGLHASKGLEGGVVMSACFETRVCVSDPNSCGQVSTGVINCSTTGSTWTCTECNAVTPDNPDYFGDACTTTNACGVVREGTVRCDATCSANLAPLPGDYGEPCQSAENSCGLVNSGVIGCDGTCNALVPSDDLCGEDVIYGCTDPDATNYDPDATSDSGGCLYEDFTVGCTDLEAVNYDPDADIENGSCYYSTTEGCGDPDALNYVSGLENIDNSLCVYAVSGCTNESATNYNPLAVIDDGSCTLGACPVGTVRVGGHCTPTNAVVPNIECSLDEDWSDDDNSCDQIFNLQSASQPIYMRATPMRADGGAPACTLNNYQWSITGGNNVAGSPVGNKLPTMTLSSYSGDAEVSANFTNDSVSKIFYRTMRINGTPSTLLCNTNAVNETLQVRMIDIQVIEE